MKRIIALVVSFLMVLGIVFAFAQYTNRTVTYRSKTAVVGSAKQRVVVIINPKTVGKTSVTLSSSSVILDNTVVDLSGGTGAYLKVYINANIK